MFENDTLSLYEDLFKLERKTSNKSKAEADDCAIRLYYRIKDPNFNGCETGIELQHVVLLAGVIFVFLFAVLTAFI
jgi:hypothetical protein